MRDSFSANERRIADFILENSQYLRDYSSQQLAQAVNVSQSSIVKFSQKLGYKGYPDLKLAINESVVTARLTESDRPSSNEADSVTLLQQLSGSSADVISQLHTLNKASEVKAFAKQLIMANRVFFMATTLGKESCQVLAQQLFNFGIPSTLFENEPQLHGFLNQPVKQGDLLVLMDDAEYSPGLSSLLQTASHLGTKCLLIAPIGQSRYAGLAEHSLYWYVSDSETPVAEYQARITVLSLITAVQMSMQNQSHLLEEL